MYRDDFVDVDEGEKFKFHWWGPTFVLVKKTFDNIHAHNVERRWSITANEVPSGKTYEGTFEDYVVITGLFTKTKRVRCWRSKKKFVGYEVNRLYPKD